MKIEDLKRTEKERAALLEFIADPNQFIVISGANGTGKTYAAQALRWNISQKLRTNNQDEDPIFYTQAELNMKWAEYNTKPDWNLYLLKQLQNTCLLTIDDLGTRTPTDAFVDFLYAVVDSRYNRKKPTIITTNLSSKVMREKFSDAFVSRCASGVAIRFEGEDRRFEGKNF